MCATDWAELGRGEGDDVTLGRYTPARPEKTAAQLTDRQAHALAVLIFETWAAQHDLPVWDVDFAPSHHFKPETIFEIGLCVGADQDGLLLPPDGSALHAALMARYRGIADLLLG